MTQYTININEKTKAGQFFISFMKEYAEKFNAIRLIKTPNAVTKKAIEDARAKKVEAVVDIDQFLANL